MKMNEPRVTAVIVTYRSRQTIGAALDELYAAYTTGLAEVVVVDNASSDGTADLVAEGYPWVTLIRSEENDGFGRGCNRGFKHVTTPYVLVLNPDAVIKRASLAELLAFMDQNERVGMCGPAVKEKSGDLQPAGALPTPLKIIMEPLFARWATGMQRPIVPGERPARTNWLCGSILLLRWSVLDEVGGFDPRFFLYFEESDLCRRAQDAGWEIWTVGTAVCEHVNAASAQQLSTPMFRDTIAEHYFQSRFYYIVKHHGRIWAVLVELGELASMFCRAVLEAMRGRTYPYLGPRLRAPMFRLPRRPAASAVRA